MTEINIKNTLQTGAGKHPSEDGGFPAQSHKKLPILACLNVRFINTGIICTYLSLAKSFVYTRYLCSILSENFIWKTNSIFSIFSKLDADSHN